MSVERTAGALRLDLGCGATRRAGFIGLDRFSLTGVDVVSDLDGPALPFADNSFALIVAFHSLEHVRDGMHVMREIWRVCTPGAQVVIGAPYFTSHLNLANPYHKQVFNEHTPRFWTTCPDADVDPADWQEPPFGGRWGLAGTDHSTPDFDFRCARMEFFYFEDYCGLSPDAQRRHRKRRLNVCEQILYHLVAMKPPADENDIARVRSAPYMPPELEARRNRARAAWRWRLWRR